MFPRLAGFRSGFVAFAEQFGERFQGLGQREHVLLAQFAKPVERRRLVAAQRAAQPCRLDHAPRTSADRCIEQPEPAGKVPRRGTFRVPAA